MPYTCVTNKYVHAKFEDRRAGRSRRSASAPIGKRTDRQFEFAPADASNIDLQGTTTQTYDYMVRKVDKTLYDLKGEVSIIWLESFAKTRMV